MSRKKSKNQKEEERKLKTDFPIKEVTKAECYQSIEKIFIKQNINDRT